MRLFRNAVDWVELDKGTVTVTMELIEIYIIPNTERLTLGIILDLDA